MIQRSSSSIKSILLRKKAQDSIIFGQIRVSFLSMPIFAQPILWINQIYLSEWPINSQKDSVLHLS